MSRWATKYRTASGKQCGTASEPLHLCSASYWATKYRRASGKQCGTASEPLHLCSAS